jgi:hypothetical protein
LLLTPLNKHVDEMNSRILQMNSGEEYVYYSADYFAEEAAELELTCQMFGWGLGLKRFGFRFIFSAVNHVALV